MLHSIKYISLPSHSAVKAGVATLMTGFNEINGIPATAHKYLQSELLKETGFKGFTVSDWGSIGEIARHGMGKTTKMLPELPS